MVRELVIVTDGAGVQVVRCAWTPLEVKAGLDILLQAINEGRFPMPNGMPVVQLPGENADARTSGPTAETTARPTDQPERGVDEVERS